MKNYGLTALKHARSTEATKSSLPAATSRRIGVFFPELGHTGKPGVASRD